MVVSGMSITNWRVRMVMRTPAEVARMDGPLAIATNSRLIASIASNNPGITGDQLYSRMEGIRVGLAQEHVLALDATGATEATLIE